ncbi:hypothetical protein B0J13DRAFT_568643 [Dactylonectria estremocensis]|uniref:Uncharacterized protein n=1 Tax=Dactylonectria estremocensis TaxID=1079267 RepID=A0A9P9IHY3_9HYPO|nr:hypothetical protein B0J13DRAFT_568643 [Dactylonectria estremocensis]
MTVTMIPCASKHRASRLNCSAMLALLHVVRPLDAHGRIKKSWALCCVCYRYRPKRKNYWKGAKKRNPRESASGILVGHDSIVHSCLLRIFWPSPLAVTKELVAAFLALLEERLRCRLKVSNVTSIN